MDFIDGSSINSTSITCSLKTSDRTTITDGSSIGNFETTCNECSLKT